MPNPTDSRRILELLSQGKITVDEADQLLRAIDGAAADAASQTAPDTASRAAAARWLRVTVDKAARDGRPRKQVSIRVPMALVRGGVKLGAIVPKLAHEPLGKHFRDHGIDVDFSKIDLSQIDAVLNNLGETTIDVDEGKAQVRITCE
jgi:hypothetical protein